MVRVDWKTAAVLVGGVLLAYVVLRRDAVEVVKGAATAINPASPENVFYKATSGVVNAISGDGNKDATLGTRIYDWIHGADK